MTVTWIIIGGMASLDRLAGFYSRYKRAWRCEKLANIDLTHPRAWLRCRLRVTWFFAKRVMSMDELVGLHSKSWRARKCKKVTEINLIDRGTLPRDGSATVKFAR